MTYQTRIAINGISLCIVFLLGLSAAVAEGKMSIGTLPDAGKVMVTGTVEKVTDAQEIRLRDESGSIAVRMPPNQSAVLSQGDKITVTGTVEKGMLGLTGKHINASAIDVQKSLVSQVSDAIKEHTDISVDKAKDSSISGLPAEGMVKLSGTVDTIKDEKNFTLKDKTGTIDVTVQSEENVILAKDTGVVVVGYVHKDLFGKKDIRATHVILTANTEQPASSYHSPAR